MSNEQIEAYLERKAKMWGEMIASMTKEQLENFVEGYGEAMSSRTMGGN
jgi:hypothetical protein